MGTHNEIVSHETLHDTWAERIDPDGAVFNEFIVPKAQPHTLLFEPMLSDGAERPPEDANGGTNWSSTASVRLPARQVAVRNFGRAIKKPSLAAFVM